MESKKEKNEHFTGSL